jgi:mRNA interferase MazF
MTSELVEVDFRVMVEPSAESGLRERSQIMADKPVTIRRERVGRTVGRLGVAEMARLNTALAFVMGLAD